MLTIDAQLKNGDLSRFQLLYGEEAYLVRNYKNKLKQALSVPGDDMNASYFEGEKFSVEEMQSIGNTLPFFQDKRLILIENSQAFKKATDLVEVLEQFPETTFVVFVEKQIDKRNRLYKWIQKMAALQNVRCVPRSNWYHGSRDICPNMGKRFPNIRQNLSYRVWDFRWISCPVNLIN